MFNLVDWLLVTMVVGAAVWGWKTGTLFQLTVISAALAGLTAAARSYEPLGAFLNAFAPLLNPAFVQGLGYFAVMCSIAAAGFLALRWLYPRTRLAISLTERSWWLDNCGGALLGLVLGILLAVAMVDLVEVFAFPDWPVMASYDRRAALHYMVAGSVLVQQVFFESGREFADHLSYWLPGLAVLAGGSIQE